MNDVDVGSSGALYVFVNALLQLPKGVTSGSRSVDNDVVAAENVVDS